MKIASTLWVQSIPVHDADGVLQMTFVDRDLCFRVSVPSASVLLHGAPQTTLPMGAEVELEGDWSREDPMHFVARSGLVLAEEPPLALAA